MNAFHFGADNITIKKRLIGPCNVCYRQLNL